MAVRKRKKAAVRRRRGQPSRLRLLARRGLPLLAAVFGAWLIYEAGRFPDVGALEHSNPGRTAFMELREREAAKAGKRYRIEQHWVALERCSSDLRRAVLAAEDDRFYEHDGFDFEEMRSAVEDTVREGKKLRGASTISQQLAKNLWLGPDRSLLRKVREAAYTFALERRLSKERILELYLNVAEWGPQVFGAEAAARHHFGVSAARLDAGQAALLAAALPNPLERDPSHPSSSHQRRARRILARIGAREATAVRAAPVPAPERPERQPRPAATGRPRPTPRVVPHPTAHPRQPVSTPEARPVPESTAVRRSTPPAGRPTPRDVLQATPTPNDLLSPPG